MSILDLTDADIRRALRRMSAPDDSVHPILHSALVSHRLHEARLPDRARHRWWVLSELVREVVAERVGALREDPATASLVMQLNALGSPAIPQLFDALCLNGDEDLRAWTSLSCRYCCLDLGPHERLHEVLGVNQRSLQRWLRLGVGLLRRRLHELDVALLPETIDELPAAAWSAVPAQVDDRFVALINHWSGEPYRLDECFIAPRLVLSQAGPSGGEDATPRTFGVLSELLGELPRGPLVLLGPPGAGKSTLLRQYELATAQRALSGGPSRMTFLVPLRSYPALHQSALPEPWQWLGELWSRQNPGLPSLQTLWCAGTLDILLDGLNELPHATSREYWELVSIWKRLIWEFADRQSNSRLVVTCRSTDYIVPIDSPELAVTVIHLDPWDDQRMQHFLQLHGVPDARQVLRDLREHQLLELARTPDRLRLLTEWWHSRPSTGQLPEGLILAWIRGALRREVLADNQLFAPGSILTEEDLRRVVHATWGQCLPGLPDGGPLMRSLGDLARSGRGNDRQAPTTPAWHWRQDALSALAQSEKQGQALLRAGLALGVLEEFEDGNRLAFCDLTVQDYFARWPQSGMAN